MREVLQGVRKYIRIDYIDKLQLSITKRINTVKAEKEGRTKLFFKIRYDRHQIYINY